MKKLPCHLLLLALSGMSVITSCETTEHDNDDDDHAHRVHMPVSTTTTTTEETIVTREPGATVIHSPGTTIRTETPGTVIRTETPGRYYTN